MRVIWDVGYLRAFKHYRASRVDKFDFVDVVFELRLGMCARRCSSVGRQIFSGRTPLTRSIRDQRRDANKSDSDNCDKGSTHDNIPR